MENLIWLTLLVFRPFDSLKCIKLVVFETSTYKSSNMATIYIIKVKKKLLEFAIEIHF